MMFFQPKSEPFCKAALKFCVIIQRILLTFFVLLAAVKLKDAPVFHDPSSARYLALADSEPSGSVWV